jgi:transposase
MVEGTKGSHNKEGSRKMSKHNTICAGIDTGKGTLDVAINGSKDQLQVDNTPEGHSQLSGWLRKRRVKRVGIEASGGYEQAVVQQLRRDGFVVVVFQPAEVRAYAVFHRLRAKNDKMDAGLIAICTAAVPRIHAPPDPRLAPFAVHLTFIEQLGEDIARLKTRCESCPDARLRQAWKKRIADLKAELKGEFATLVAAIRTHQDLAQRLDLMTSVNGVGLRTAVAILVRMPEIGSIDRQHLAALAGLAPYDDDSGKRVGERHIKDGRTRLRTSLYSAALPASFRWNARLVAFYRRLIAAGKRHKVALIACARKLLCFVNTVVQRGTPWIENPAAT